MSQIRADLFCRVVDNLGDIGVMWRLAKQLATEKKWTIRLWVDDMAALTRLLPSLTPNLNEQQHAGITIIHWQNNAITDQAAAKGPREVVIAGFSCELPAAFIAQMQRPTPPIWLQLEYLSAEPWVPGFHGHSSQRRDGLAPIFFFPGFEAGTGGLLRESELIEQRNQWQSDLTTQLQWLSSLGVHLTKQARDTTRLVSLFAYPDAPVDALLASLEQLTKPTIVFAPGHPTFERLPDKLRSTEHIGWQPIDFLSSTDYDRLLWSMDLNIVRGEDSLVRAIWAQRPLIWHIYPQEAQAHALKLNAWLARTSLPSQVQTAMQQWVQGGAQDQLDQSLSQTLTQTLSSPTWSHWQAASAQFSQTMAQMPDLATQIDKFCRPRSSLSQLPADTVN